MVAVVTAASAHLSSAADREGTITVTTDPDCAYATRACEGASVFLEQSNIFVDIHAMTHPTRDVVVKRVSSPETSHVPHKIWAADGRRNDATVNPLKSSSGLDEDMNGLVLDLGTNAS